MNSLRSIQCLSRQAEENRIKIKTITRYWVVFLVTLAAFAVGVTVPAHADGSKESQRAGPTVVEIEDARLKFEINSTDLDGGVQVFLDTDPWKWMMIFDPNGRLIFRSTARGSIGKQGGTELFLESGEPEFSEQSLEELLELFPEGDYRFIGRGLEREILVGTAVLTHNIADGPVLVSPLEGDDPVDPNNTVVTWESVGDANGSPIIAYQVLVVQDGTGFPALPKASLDVMMPASATSLAVPPGFCCRIPSMNLKFSLSRQVATKRFPRHFLQLRRKHRSPLGWRPRLFLVTAAFFLHVRLGSTLADLLSDIFVSQLAQAFIKLFQEERRILFRQYHRRLYLHNVVIGTVGA